MNTKNNAKMTLGEAIDRYIDSKSAVLSPSTVYGYKKIRRQYTLSIQDVPLDIINQEILQKFINNKSKCYAPKTIRNIFGLIHATLQMHRPELIVQITLPQKIKTSLYVPDEDEIEMIYTKIKHTPLEIPFLLASKCGLRPSEISALKTDCVKKDYIEICRAVVTDENGKEVTKPPKTYAGYRDIPIPLQFGEQLLNSSVKNRICALSPNKISRDWHKFLLENGFRSFKFYALRHYFASQALLLGIPQKYIAEIMGHSSLDMIEKVYQHTFPSAMDEFKNRLCKSTQKLIK